MLVLVLLLASPFPPAPKVSCIARRQDIVVYDREKKETHEDEDWLVDCTIKINDLTIFSAPLPLLHPSTFQEAMGAIDEFRTKKAPQIVSDYKKGTK